jgi:DNA recombination protein RmuC
MIFYIPVVFSIVLASALAYVTYKNAGLKMHLRFLEEASSADKAELEILEKERIEYIQKIEQLSGKLQYQQQFIQEFEKLRDESKSSTKAALFDLGNELSKQLIELHKKENKESREFSEKNIKETAEKFNSEFERIVNMVGSLSKEVSQSKDTVDVIKNSLLSPSGAGSLAEITLENILKSSGLRPQIDFMMQYSVSGDDSEILRPDAVVFLPSDKLMIIDAKASKFLVDDQDDLKNLAKTMNSHLRSLAGKNYSDVVRKTISAKQSVRVGNVVTLMFVPSEHAIEKILEADSDFMNKAWKANIFPVGPAGLMNMLSFAKFQISEQMMLHNHQQIIEEVKKLISSIGIMADHSGRLGNSISSVVNHYDKFAASFNRSFLSKAKSIGKMGIECDVKKDQTPLQRLHVVSSKADLIDVEPEQEQAEEEVKKLEEV